MENILEYAKSMNANEEVLNWLSTAAKNALKKQKTTVNELEHILDYLVSDKAPKRLSKMSIDQAKSNTEKWVKANQKKGRNLVDTKRDIETVLKFDDGCSVVRLKTKKAFEREGFMMSHCVGGYSPDTGDYDIYSYRDQYNNPHATFEVRKNSDEVAQIKGKGNGDIHPKYINPVLEFLKFLGMDIRPNDMKNLGYYHIDEAHIGFVTKLTKSKENLTIIGDNYYVR